MAGRGGHLADVLPIDRAAIESLSWTLGSRVTGGDATCLLELRDRSTPSALAVFEATEYTYVVRFRTPVGREKFFGVAAVDLRSMLADLVAQDGWELDRGGLDAI
ncbi:hypothetical protein [Halorhabdus sp. CUG00001]|uniref:hypothetical protein n=1 Tax=Halorhabdus sp. CUG00001 TaxID=2600297 RepID=UPI00131C8A94|nr:hypothetical protein [Halorhabdus sp. CUG00001]